jgi:hypothetical protein
MQYQKILLATTNGKAPKFAQFARFPDPKQGIDSNSRPCVRILTLFSILRGWIR